MFPKITALPDAAPELRPGIGTANPAADAIREQAVAAAMDELPTVGGSPVAHAGDVAPGTAAGWAVAVTGESLAADDGADPSNLAAYVTGAAITAGRITVNEAPEPPAGQPADRDPAATRPDQPAKAGEAVPGPETLDPERELMEHFPELLAALDLPALMLPLRGRTVEHPEQFRLIPIIQELRRKTLDAGWSTDPADPTVRCTYNSPYQHNWPHLDTRQAIGLVKSNYLIAVSGAGIDADGRMEIRQIQDVTGQRKPARDDGIAMERYRSSGLHDGFWWRATLARGWEKIATRIGVTTAIIPHYRNTTWWTESTQAVRPSAFDDVARMRHYRRINPDDPYSDWIKHLPPASD